MVQDQKMALSFLQACMIDLRCMSSQKKFDKMFHDFDALEYMVYLLFSDRDDTELFMTCIKQFVDTGRYSVLRGMYLNSIKK